jgi:hypothetical protein
MFLQLATHPHYILDLAPLSHDAKVAGERLAHFLICNRANLSRLLSEL